MIDGTIRLYRIASLSYPIFDGAGARLHGARWNSPGRSVIYASANLSCARLEILAHSGRTTPPVKHAFVEIEVPGELAIEEVDIAKLPVGWDAIPDRHIARHLGDEWLAKKASALLRVPSIASIGDYNYLINQEHPDFSTIACGPPVPLLWDSRLFS